VKQNELNPTPGQALLGRKVIHFIDNVAAVVGLIKGYSGSPDLARIANVGHAHMLALKVDAYFEYVNTKANIADLPSRGMIDETMNILTQKLGVKRENIIRVRMHLPELDGWLKPSSAHVQAARTREPVVWKSGRKRHVKGGR
jgi:hypothetical protein